MNTFLPFASSKSVEREIVSKLSSGSCQESRTGLKAVTKETNLSGRMPTTRVKKLTGKKSSE